MIYDWKGSDFWKAILNDSLVAIGGFASLSAFAQFFPQMKPLEEFLKTNSVLEVFLISSALLVLYKNWPQKFFCYRIQGKDINVAMGIGNMFRQKGSFIIPINDEFDVELKGTTMSTQSTLSQVVKRYFDKDCHALQKAINKSLKQSGVYPSNGRYKLGTTIRVMKDDARFYFVANSSKTNPGRVEAKGGDDLLLTLSGLWAYLAANGSKETLIIPLLGTMNGKMGAKRETVFKEIVRSFTASCAEKSYCEELIIAVQSKDVRKWAMDLKDLDEFLKLNTKHADFDDLTEKPTGTIADAPVTQPVTLTTD